MSSSKASKATGAKRRPAVAKKAAKPAAKRTVVKRAGVKSAAKSAAKPAAAKAAANGTVSAEMSATAAAMEKVLAAGDLASLSNDSLQKLMAVAVKVYSAKRESGDLFLPLTAAGRVTPTDIMLTSSQLLRAGNLQVFELGMWQSWTGN